MPIAECAGGCPRVISLSVDPAGNPVAAAHQPEHFATHYRHCPSCRRFWCERCVGEALSCSRCEGPLESPTPRHALDILFGGRIPEGLLASLDLGAAEDDSKRQGGN
ncbi:hypothetical protein VZQ01_32805 [Myxococcus faecalis]|uniref:hypothetical protein n=1 Tax=Myxococcus faecalis TaxID=3115646 RepID=UPI003CE9F02A